MPLESRKKDLKEYYEDPDKVESFVEGDKSISGSHPKHKWLNSEFAPQAPYSHVLHLGCGTGRWHYFTSEYAQNVSGIDISHSMVAEAKRKTSTDHTVVGDVLNLPYLSSIFDAIVSMGVLQEQIPLSGEVLQEIDRVLSPDGQIYFSLQHQYHQQFLKARIAKLGKLITPRAVTRRIERKYDMASLDSSIEYQLNLTSYDKQNIDEPLSDIGLTLKDVTQVSLQKGDFLLVHATR